VVCPAQDPQQRSHRSGVQLRRLFGDDPREPDRVPRPADPPARLLVGNRGEPRTACRPGVCGGLPLWSAWAGRFRGRRAVRPMPAPVRRVLYRIRNGVVTTFLSAWSVLLGIC
jgi:hypothetical protein